MLAALPIMSRPELNELCLQCGLCCNGVIFAKGELQPRDDAARLRALGLRFARPAAGGGQKFHQPCSMLEGCRCQIYSQRPDYCRRFECVLFKNLKAGTTTFESAQRTIRKTLRQVKRVQGLLKQLGDQRNDLPLGARFRRVQKRLEQGSVSADSISAFGELTLAMHQLNVLLGESFYPGD